MEIEKQLVFFRPKRRTEDTRAVEGSKERSKGGVPGDGINCPRFISDNLQVIFDSSQAVFASQELFLQQHSRNNQFRSTLNGFFEHPLILGTAGNFKEITSRCCEITVLGSP